MNERQESFTTRIKGASGRVGFWAAVVLFGVASLAPWVTRMFNFGDELNRFLVHFVLRYDPPRQPYDATNMDLLYAIASVQVSFFSMCILAAAIVARKWNTLASLPQAITEGHRREVQQTTQKFIPIIQQIADTSSIHDSCLKAANTTASILQRSHSSPKRLALTEHLLEGFLKRLEERSADFATRGQRMESTEERAALTHRIVTTAEKSLDDGIGRLGWAILFTQPHIIDGTSVHSVEGFSERWLAELEDYHERRREKVPIVYLLLDDIADLTADQQARLDLALRSVPKKYCTPYVVAGLARQPIERLEDRLSSLGTMLEVFDMRFNDALSAGRRFPRFDHAQIVPEAVIYKATALVSHGGPRTAQPLALAQALDLLNQYNEGKTPSRQKNLWTCPTIGSVIRAGVTDAPDRLAVVYQALPTEIRQSELILELLSVASVSAHLPE